jgi:hypothetical protein
VESLALETDCTVGAGWRWRILLQMLTGR